MWDRFDDAMDDVTRARIALVDEERELRAKLVAHGLRFPEYREPKEEDGAPGVSWANDALDAERRELHAYRDHVARLRKLVQMIS